MARLNIERQNEQEPERIKFAFDKLTSIGIDPILVTQTDIRFIFKGEQVIFYPYSGWHTGKSIKDGRGLKNLLKQIK